MRVVIQRVTSTVVSEMFSYFLIIKAYTLLGTTHSTQGFQANQVKLLNKTGTATNSCKIIAAEGETISSIGRGLCVLVGISRDDTQKDIDYIVKKILNLRLFGLEDERKWSSSVVDQALEIMCLSQITLYHSLKGNRLDFHKAMSPKDSQPFYQQFLDTMRQQYLPDKVKEGRFGAHIVVNINNDGPVTVCLESPAPPAIQQKSPQI